MRASVDLNVCNGKKGSCFTAEAPTGGTGVWVVCILEGGTVG